jgi:hypothetical protein
MRILVRQAAPTEISTGSMIAPGRMPATRGERHRLGMLIAAGVLLEAGLIGIVALSYQIGEKPSFTDALAPRGSALWNALFPVLALLDRVSPPVIGPERTMRAAVLALLVPLVLASLGYLAAIAVLHRGDVAGRFPLRVVLGFLVVFQATLLVMPGVYSSDVFSYAMYGRLAATYAVNPYAVTPAAVPLDPIAEWVDWKDLVTPYGPLWTDLSAAVAVATRTSPPVVQILAYRLLMSAVLFASVGVAWRVLGAMQPPDSGDQPRVASLAVLAWNPLVLLEVVGNAHNDGLLVLWMLLGLLALAAWPRTHLAVTSTSARAVSLPALAWLTALACAVLGALVKYVPVLVGVVWTCAWLAQLSGWRARIGAAAAVAVLGLGLSIGLAWPWLNGVSEFDTLYMVLAGGQRHANDLAHSAAPWLANNVLIRLPMDPSLARDVAQSGLGWAARAAFVLVLLFVVRRTWLRHRRGSLDMRWLVWASAAILLAALLLLVTQVLAWYFVWPVAVASLLGLRSMLAKVTVALSLTFWPVYYLRHYALGPDELLAVYVLVPLAMPLASLLPRFARSWRR